MVKFTKAASQMHRPSFLCLPYLPLTGDLSFGGWWLGPLNGYSGRWLSEDFEHAARIFLASFRDTSAVPIKNPSVLARVDSGLDGVPPSAREYEALCLAIGFGTIHQNPFWSPDAVQNGLRIATSDNADLWQQPIDVVHHYVTLGRGSRLRVKEGGRQFTEKDFVVPAPLELVVLPPVTLDRSRGLMS